MDQPDPVVREILRGFDRGKRVVYQGKLANRMGTWGATLLPRNAILRLAQRFNVFIWTNPTASSLPKVRTMFGPARAVISASSAE